MWMEFFNRCLETGKIPKKWRKAMIKILYKDKGDTDKPETYRGVALDSTGLKMLIKLLVSRISLFIEQFLPDEQFGFR